MLAHIARSIYFFIHHALLIFSTLFSISFKMQYRNLFAVILFEVFIFLLNVPLTWVDVEYWRNNIIWKIYKATSKKTQIKRVGSNFQNTYILITFVVYLRCVYRKKVKVFVRVCYFFLVSHLLKFVWIFVRHNTGNWNAENLHFIVWWNTIRTVLVMESI